MKIIVSQQNKRIEITFQQGEVVDRCAIDKAEDFLVVVDKFIKRRRMGLKSFKKAGLEFLNTGVLTERVIKAIMLGISIK